MSVKCEQPFDELTDQVWLLYHRPNFKYCTLYKGGTELQINIYTSSVFCYDKHKKNFDIHFSMKRHEPV